MSDPLGRTLGRLTRVAGVRGALVVDTEAGIPVSSDVMTGIDEKALAALAGSLFRRTGDASRSAGFGGVRVLQLEAEAGHVVAAAAGSLLVVVLADPGTQLGLVRVQAAQAAEELRQ
jgi:predicted regulator of Ras-like GTPase activity (Roadblock/LC7/MglB family)